MHTEFREETSCKLITWKIKEMDIQH